MGLWNFRLRQMFLWTAAIALGLVALRSASTLWVAAGMGLATMTVALSLLLVAFRRGPQRAYWIGFATFGWLYLLMLVASWTLARIAGNDSPLAAHNLPTQRLSSYTYHKAYDQAFENYRRSHTTVVTIDDDLAFYLPGIGPIDPMSALAVSAPPVPGPPANPPGPSENDFVNVAHAFWTLLLAIVGGCVAHWLYVTGRSEDLPAGPKGES